MRIHPRSLWGAAVLACCMLASLSAAQTPTRLQVLSTSDPNTAQSAAASVERLGYGPAEIQEADATYTVLTRTFGSFAEASFARSYCHGAGFQNVVDVNDGTSPSPRSVFGNVPSVARAGRLAGVQLDFQSRPASVERPPLTEELRALDNGTAPEELLFQKGMAVYPKDQPEEPLAALEAFIQRFPGSASVARAKLMRGYWLVNKGDLQNARSQFLAAAAEHPAHTEAGEAALRVAYLMIRQNDPEVDTLQQFLLVARGDVPATDDVRCEAMLRAAALFHRGKDLDTAEAAYQHIEQYAAGDPEIQAFARMQRAGLIMEKAWNDQATFAQAREVCDGLLAEFPGVNKQTRATAALMAMETLCYERDFAPVLGRGNAFLSEFSDTPEAPLARYWIALARLETGDTARAIHDLDALIQANYDTSSRFKILDLQASARRLLEKAKARSAQVVANQ